jgi:vancomycin resistance protein YoaR
MGLLKPIFLSNGLVDIKNISYAMDMRIFKYAAFLLALFGLTLSSSALTKAANEKKTTLENKTVNSQISFLVKDKREIIDSQEALNWFSVNLVLRENNDYRSEIENLRLCPTKEVFCRLLWTERKSKTIEKNEQFIINDEAIELFLTELANKIKKEPGEARFKMEDSKVMVFAPSEEGLELDIASSKNKIVDLIKANNGQLGSAEIVLEYKTIDPINNIGDLNNLKITDLIGEGKSNFRGSPKNRIFNIKVATERFNGILISPGEEFSFVKTLGPVDGEHGYLPELVIKNNKTEPEFGGGICQVSTTTFRAAIYSGLEITARRNHAYPVSYYNPQGLDATVYIPLPDLRFINNTPGYILIQTLIEGTQLTFQFWGTNDGRKTEVTGPWVTERGEDGAMKTEFNQKVTTADSEVLLNETFKSNYESPNKYPHPGEEITEKPKDWSKKQWDEYKKAHNMN